MQTNTLAVALVALLVLPAAAGFAAPTGGTDDAGAAGLDAGGVADQQGGSGAETETGGSGSGGADRGSAPANYTRLYVDSERPYLELEPGGEAEFTVTVENGEDEAVALDPHVYVPPVGGPVLDASWVSIDGPERLDAGEEAEYDVTVSVPEDAEVGRYRGQVAFTDETVTYPGRPARPVHAQHVRVEVWREPTVQVHSRTYVHAQVEAGESITQEVVVENTGEEPVPLSPELARERATCHGDCPEQFERSWLDVDAPSQVDPGETATVTVTVSPPADASAGRYDARLDLGLKDPNRAERDSHWQVVDLNLEVWRQPEEPVETSFDVSGATESLTVTLRPRDGPYRPSGDAEPVDFEVSLVGPNGSVVEPERVRVTDRGFVDMSGDRRRAVGEDGYVVRGGGQEFVYRLDAPAAGEWTLRVTPENTVGFAYEVTREESG